MFTHFQSHMQNINKHIIYITYTYLWENKTGVKIHFCLKSENLVSVPVIQLKHKNTIFATLFHTRMVEKESMCH